ncbi:MAG TPA: hypothetical protein VLS93_10425, partial [Anaeromyxobacteraceae bacterium]|nr:hypothetical protein [Anaeromyxobacteraceae bacterium]
DFGVANAIDWVVEGSTYGCYVALTDGGGTDGGANYGTALTLQAEADIDGDVPANGVTAAACVVLFKPVLDATGAVSLPSPAPTCGAAPAVAAPWGNPQRWPDDNTF